NGAFGVFAGNAGAFAGDYQLVTNSYSVYYETNSGTNVLGGVATNVMVNGTNEIIAGTNVLAGRTNVVGSIVTNVVSGSGNNYTNVTPAGGASVVNAGRITTAGTGSYGILAQSEPGSINLQLNGNTVV